MQWRCSSPKVYKEGCEDTKKAQPEHDRMPMDAAFLPSIPFLERKELEKRMTILRSEGHGANFGHQPREKVDHGIDFVLRIEAAEGKAHAGPGTLVGEPHRGQDMGWVQRAGGAG